MKFYNTIASSRWESLQEAGYFETSSDEEGIMFANEEGVAGHIDRSGTVHWLMEE